MKRIQSCLLVALMLLGISFQAKAEPIHIEWDTPGALVFYQGYGTVPLEVPATATSFDYDLTGSCKVALAPGYLFDKVLYSNGSDWAEKVIYNNASPFFLPLSDFAGKTVKITTEKINFDSKITVKVAHSPEIVDYVTFLGTSAQYKNLEKGDNILEFSSKLDDKLEIKPKYGVDPVTGTPNNSTGNVKFYSIKKNNESLDSKYFYGTYKNIEIADDDVIEIVPFENAPEEQEKKESTVSFSLPTGLDCIASVFNRTTFQFIYTAGQFKNEPITVPVGTILQFNLNVEDVNYTQVKIGDTEYDLEDVADKGYVRYTVTTDDVTLAIKAAAKEYGTRTLTVYAENPQGIELWAKKGTQGYELEFKDGEDYTGTIELSSTATRSKGKYTMQNVKKYTFEISNKYPTCMWLEKEGYWIYGVSSTKFDEAEIPFDGETLYIVAREIKADTRAVVYLEGAESGVSLKANAKWGSTNKYPLTAGYNFVDFDKVYDVDFSVMGGANTIAGVYLDGAAVSKDENEQYSGIAAVENSVIKVYIGATAVKSSTVTFSSVNEATAKVTYDLVKTIETLPSTNKFTNGTKVTIEPLAGAALFINESLVELDNEGKYTFTTVGGKNYAVHVANPGKVTPAVKPAEGETVKSLSKVVLEFPVNGELMYMPTDKFESITVTNEAGATVATVTTGEAGTNDEYTVMYLPLLLNKAIVEGGKYTVNVPEGAFVEVGYDETTDAFTQKPTSNINAALAVNITVDPTIKTALDYVKVTPASGHALKSIGAVYVDFTEFKAYDMIQTAMGYEATFDYEDGTSYDAFISRNWNATDGCGFTVTPTDANGDDIALTKEGTVKLTIKAGTFTFDGDTSGAIEATYTIHASHPVYPITPVHGSTTSRLVKATIVFPGVVEATHNAAKTITLTGVYDRAQGEVTPQADAVDFTAQAATVTKGASDNEYHIVFETEPSVKGQYTINVPAGAFSLDEEDCLEASATFTYVPTWVLTPEAGGAPVESLEEILISFPSATTVARGNMDDDEVAFRAIDNSWAPISLTVTEVAGAEVPTYAIKCTPAPTQIKTYSLLIPEGFFKVDGEDSQEINVNYTLANNVADVNYEFTPTGKLLKGEYMNFGINFDYVHTVTVADATKIAVEVNGTALTTATYQAMTESNMFIVLIPDGNALADGTLKLTLAEGALNVSGKPSPAISNEWQLVAPKVYTLTVTPAETVEEVAALAKITIKIENADEATIVNASGVSLRSSDYSSYPFTNGVITAVEGAEVPTFEVAFPEPTKITSYVLTINYGTFLIDGVQDNERTVVTYSQISGIDSIAGDENDNVEIYNLQGIKLNAKYNELPAGLYIINGKKTVKN